MSNLNDTIVAISTPIGEGGIGIVRMSGKKALSIADKIFISKDGKKVSDFSTYSLHYGHIVHRPSSIIHRTRDEGRGTKDEIVDEVLLTVMRAPKSYTKEDIVEINCHGGIVPLRKVLEEIINCGVRLAEPGEFTKRAFLNGRIDLTQAEAVNDVIRSKTDVSLKAALGQLKGGLSTIINAEMSRLSGALAEIEAEINFSDENIKTESKEELFNGINKSKKKIKSILDTEGLGMLLREGILCVICGKPNVGKSSLLNMLLRRNRAIVTHVPGTTRDAIEESVSIKGIPVRVVDTAGILKSKNIVEKKSVEKTKEYIKKADVAIFLLDLSRTFDEKDHAISRLLNMKKTIVAANKSDLKEKLNLEKVENNFNIKIHKISILKKKNVNIVENALSDIIWSGKIAHPEASFLANIRHKKELEEALKNLTSAEASLKKNNSLELAAIDIREAIFHLGLIIGKSVDIDILDRIFENFCIGK